MAEDSNPEKKHVDKNEEKDSSNSEHEKEEEKEPGEAYIVYFVIVSLFISSCCREIKKKTGLPYSPLLLISGMILGAYIP